MAVGLAILAIFATILGGMILAFDNSLWPIDGYVLYVGQISHVLVIPTSILAFLGNSIASPRGHTAWLITQALISILATPALILTYQGMFVYGWWPS